MPAFTSIALGVAAATSTGLGVYSAVKQSQDQADQAERQAEIQRIQADEVLRRADINVKAATEQFAALKDQQISAFAKSGVDAYQGSPLLFMEETARRAKRDIQNIRDEAGRKAQLILQGADNLANQAGDIRTAGYLNAGSTFLTGAYKFANSFGAFGSSTGGGGGLSFGATDIVV